MNLDKLPRVPFQQKDQLPCSSGVYIAMDEQMTPLYVGMSQNLRQRLATHHRLKQLKSLRCAVIAWIEAPSAEIALLEKRTIEALLPQLNNTLVPRNRDGHLAIKLDSQTMQIIEALSQEAGEPISHLVSRVLTRGIYAECETRMEALGILGDD